MKPFWRSIVGILAGGADLYANGTNWRNVLVAIGIAALGLVSHLSSTSDPTAPTGVMPKKPN